MTNQSSPIIKPIACILVLAMSMNLTGCTVIGYNMGKSRDLARGVEIPTNVDVAAEVLECGSDVCLVLNSGEKLSGLIKEIKPDEFVKIAVATELRYSRDIVDGKRVRTRYVDRKSTMTGEIREIRWDEIESISILMFPSKGRVTGTVLGSILDGMIFGGLMGLIAILSFMGVTD